MEVQTHAFIQAAVEAATEADVDGDVLVGAALHDTVYGDISGDAFGVRIGDCDAECAPLPEGEGMEEFDARLRVVVFARVDGTETADRATARAKARALWLRVAGLFFDDTTMGGRVRDVLLRRAQRGFDEEGGNLYAVVSMPLLVNGTGQLLDREESYL
jgi:hypothetical protein